MLKQRCCRQVHNQKVSFSLLHIEQLRSLKFAQRHAKMFMIVAQSGYALTPAMTLLPVLGALPRGRRQEA